MNSFSLITPQLLTKQTHAVVYGLLIDSNIPAEFVNCSAFNNVHVCNKIPQNTITGFNLITYVYLSSFIYYLYVCGSLDDECVVGIALRMLPNIQGLTTGLIYIKEDEHSFGVKHILIIDEPKNNSCYLAYTT